MGWEQQMQYRHQYSTDGSCGMAWQPTAVWRDDPLSSDETYTGPARTSDAGEALIGIVALVVAGLVYLRLSHAGSIAHLSAVPRDAMLIVACLGSLAGTVRVLETKFVQSLFKTVASIGIALIAIGSIYYLI